jgi:beta-aspartyl-peptidase (threonine type)
MTSNPIAIAIHGGAGAITRDSTSPEVERAAREELETALHAGHRILTAGGTSLDAVVAAVCVLEDAPRFNAGKGAVLTHDGTVEMEASVMDGGTLRAGAATLLSRVKNPVKLARLILEQSRHVMLSGAGAEALASTNGLELEDNPYFVTPRRIEQLERALAVHPTATELSESEGEAGSTGTVGAVALDGHGNLAAATSTGGMTNKLSGRIGDSPLIGAGTYADNRSAAVSTTGHGEMFLRVAAAHELCARIRHGGASLREAASAVIQEDLSRIGGHGGLIALGPTGEIVFELNAEGMYRGAIDASGKLTTAIFANDPAR